MVSIEFEDLLCDAVNAHHDGVALGEVQVGDAAETVADGAVDIGFGVLLEVLPQVGLFGLRLGAAVQQQEDVADGHHRGKVVQHIGAQALFVPEGVEVLAVDHVSGHAQLLIHPLDHDALVHALVRAADEVAVEVKIHVVHAFDVGQRLVDEDVVHIEGVLGQHHAAVSQDLGAVDDRVHEQVLVRAEVAHMHPAEQAVLREDVGVAHGVGGVVLHMLVDVVADHQVGGGAAGHKSLQLGQHGLQGGGVQPVVAVHDLVVEAGGVADALIDTLTMTAVLLMDGFDDGGILGGVLVADGWGLVFHGTVVHKDDLGLLSSRKQGLDAMAHICRRVVARNGKGDEFLLHKMIAPFSINSRRTKNRRTWSYVLLLYHFRA